MATKLVTIKELQRRLSELLREAQEKGIRLIVMRHSVPVGTFTPFQKKSKRTRKDVLLEDLLCDIAQAEKEAAAGELFSTAEVRRMLGLKALPPHEALVDQNSDEGTP